MNTAEHGTVTLRSSGGAPPHAHLMANPERTLCGLYRGSRLLARLLPEDTDAPLCGRCRLLYLRRA